MRGTLWTGHQSITGHTSIHTHFGIWKCHIAYSTCFCVEGGNKVLRCIWLASAPMIECNPPHWELLALDGCDTIWTHNLWMIECTRFCFTTWEHLNQLYIQGSSANHQSWKIKPKPVTGHLIGVSYVFDIAQSGHIYIPLHWLFSI